MSNREMLIDFTTVTDFFSPHCCKFLLIAKIVIDFQTLMFPNQDHGRMSVSDDGTLTIEPVQKEDAGEYICKGLSIAGSAYAKARLDVKGTERQTIA